jgi:eukaryotic-like serine/threonine-protein kinase
LSSSNAGALVAGTVLDSKYRLVRELGRGGMGSVWEAHNLDLDVDVAIKVLRSDLQTSDLPGRLMREARAVARLGHPNIVRIFDVGHMANGTPFLVMELLRGGSLNDVIVGPQRMQPVVAVRTLLPIAHALTAAHEAGFVHRDLKPENIFLATQPGTSPRPILLDFGIALSWHDLSSRLTQEGIAVGTPAFMSPEQAKGDEVTYKGDIWSFSVLLYEVVTGRLPFSSTIFPRLQREIIEQPAPHFREHGVDEDELWPIVAKGLHKAPHDRWRNMREMGEALARWLLQRGVEEDVCNGSLRAIWLSPTGHDLGLASSHTSQKLLSASGSPSSQRERSRETVVMRRHSRLLTWALAIAGLAVVVAGVALGFRLALGSRPTARANAPSTSPIRARSAVEIAPIREAPTKQSQAPTAPAGPSPTAAASAQTSDATGLPGGSSRRRLAPGAKAERPKPTPSNPPSRPGASSPPASEVAERTALSPPATAPVDDIKTDF